MRLIDADALRENILGLRQKISQYLADDYKTGESDGLLTACGFILSAPTRKNAVEVVRCEDCEYWTANNAEEGDWSGKCRKYMGMCEGETTQGYDFCSDGERRESE